MKKLIKKEMRERKKGEEGRKQRINRRKNKRKENERNMFKKKKDTQAKKEAKVPYLGHYLNVVGRFVCPDHLASCASGSINS
jgi:hypothetical protein